MARLDRPRWTAAVEALRTLCPVERYGVSVRRCAMVDDGYVRSEGDDRLAVRVNRALETPQALEVLAHEWAHAMTWELEHDRCQSHSAYWGVAYAEAYRAVFNPQE